jgi:hypothetical protein
VRGLSDVLGVGRRRSDSVGESMARQCVAGRTRPDLWAEAKDRAIDRLGGRFSARAMQLAGKLYRDAGGAYCGPRTAAQRGLERWTSERWRTSTGGTACRETPAGYRCDRYLPDAAWSKLSKREIAETRKKKLSSARQWVPNAPAARAAGRIARGRK